VYDKDVDATPARVTIDRLSPDDVQQRQVIISIGDDWRAQLMYGESASHEIAPGSYVLKAHNTLVRRKIQFDAKPGEHVKFRVANLASRWALPFLTVMGVAPLNLTLERAPSEPTDQRSTS
jgi:hypothetical protein